jgi:DNA repair protein RadA/Sms
VSKPPKPVFVCQECGSQAPKWQGRCTDCGAWNSFVEERVAEAAGAGAAAAAQGHRYALPGSAAAGAKRYAEIEASSADRIPSGIGEFDRVLGGGIVPGSLVLLGGEPGIGKSTLLLQAAANFAHTVGTVLYASGEESEHQIKSRGDRLRIGDAPLYLLAETCIESILEEVGRVRPKLLVIDSIQTVFSLKFQSAPGSIGQVREAATQFLFMAKGHNIPTFLVGHVTKDGNLAGPKALEHVVDTVLYFEGERHHSHRVVRAVKNRFGAISELGVFEMTGAGLKPIANPSALFLAERAVSTPGSAVLCSIEGSRPILVEVQALASTTSYGMAKRMAVGIDQSRLSLLLAVLEKRAGLHLVTDDVFVNIAGGMAVDEPAADLAIVSAIASSVRNRPVMASTAVFGEVGLGGEIRGVPQAPLRIREAEQMGFTRIVLPAANVDDDLEPAHLGMPESQRAELVGVRQVGEALDALLS